MAQINEWIEISNTSGEGDATITLTAPTYTELIDRVANLKVSTRTKTAYVNIKQTAFEPSLSLSYNTLVFNQNELQDTTTVTSNVAWTAEPSADWITLSQTSGNSGSTTVIIEVDTIGINESRTGYVTFYYGNSVKTLVVSQAFDLEFNVNPTSIELTNGARTITVTSNVDWTATTTDDWYSLSITSGVSGTNTITVTPSTTDVSEDIFGNIDFYVDSIKIGSVAVKQLIVAENQFYIEPIESITVQFNTGRYWGEYKVNNSGWQPFNTTHNPTISSTNDRIYVRNLSFARGMSGYDSPFYITGKCNVGGDITTLILGDMQQDYAPSLFRRKSSIVNAKDLILPATTLAGNCYSYMFYGCTSLITAPTLPATTLAPYCYFCMFQGCDSLTTAPALPATNLGEGCYQRMFYSCNSLITAPELPATTLAKECYSEMFEGCTSLITAPKILPATTLADYCYSQMFYGCTSLITAPTLPATTLADDCYSQMFEGCTSLTTAPELPATTLISDCYFQMFDSCSNLNYIKMLATDINAPNCLVNWVDNVSSTGTFVKHPNMNDLPTGDSGIPKGWVVQNA